MDSSPDLLRVEEVGKSFTAEGIAKEVLAGIDFSARMGESIALLGPSGCGKTTLMLILAGLIPPSSGRVVLDGLEVQRPTPGMALVLQEYGLFPWKRVEDNILLGARIQGMTVAPETLRGLKLELGIEGLDRLYPHQLSGGQRQRVALARALLLRPRLLLLDEPFAALDAMTRERLQMHLMDLFREHGFGFVIVTHNIEEAVFLGRRVLIMGRRPATILRAVDNPGAGQAGYREDPEFFRLTVEIRRFMEVTA